MKMSDLPHLRRAWLAELGVETSRTVSGRAGPQPVRGLSGSRPSGVEAQPVEPTVPVSAPTESIPAEPASAEPVAAQPTAAIPEVVSAPDAVVPGAETSSDAVQRTTAGTLVCRLYRQGPGEPAWLVVVDMQELGPSDSGQRLFLGRMLRACGLRRSEGGPDVTVYESATDVIPVSLEAACEEAPVNGVLLIGTLAARAVESNGPAAAPSVTLYGRELPAAILPALVDVSASATGKAAAWRALSGLRSRL